MKCANLNLQMPQSTNILTKYGTWCKNCEMPHKATTIQNVVKIKSYLMNTKQHFPIHPIGIVHRMAYLVSLMVDQSQTVNTKTSFPLLIYFAIEPVSNASINPPYAGVECRQQTKFDQVFCQIFAFFWSKICIFQNVISIFEFSMKNAVK